MDLEAHRAELTAYCYRMLGSVHDAEDLVQETLLRAWKARDRYDASRASVRTWLYRIATNVCLTALESRKRRPLPSGIGAASQDTEAPLKPALDVPWLEPFPDARFSVEARVDLRLAWVAAMQELPARQRAVLVLRDVLEFSAAEVAEQLDTTVASVNSALQRARVTVRGVERPEAVREADDPEQRAVVERYLRAFEDADVPGLVRLLTDDVIMEMPPVPLWYQGRDDYARFMERVFRLNGTGWRCRLTTANGQPAMAAYVPDPAAGDGYRSHSAVGDGYRPHSAVGDGYRPGSAAGDGYQPRPATPGYQPRPATAGYRPHSLQVLTIAEGLVTANVVFADPRLFNLFGL